MPRRSAATGRQRARCAIYTRKSTEEGLEQDFNTLDAQREACEAFILSQKQEGWVALPSRYDDGGYSGGTLERPALQRLLDDIRGSKVDAVVVYKIDRLTRSLLDFAKIVEVFDAHGVSFVSVTQAFNTATSMGRLTLNVLLSFAQFEREVTGERIRDKMRMVIDDGSEPAKVDPVLVRLLLRAQAIRARLLEEPSLPLKEIAAEEGISSSYVTRLLRLAFLAPDIVTAILNGRHPPQLTAHRLMENTRLPLDWTAQRELLCF
jgi:DNA invertase Pin-like site-specific DNA recombinase